MPHYMLITVTEHGVEFWFVFTSRREVELVKSTCWSSSSYLLRRKNLSKRVVEKPQKNAHPSSAITQRCVGSSTFFLHKTTSLLDFPWKKKKRSIYDHSLQVRGDHWTSVPHLDEAVLKRERKGRSLGQDEAFVGVAPLLPVARVRRPRLRVRLGRLLPGSETWRMRLSRWAGSSSSPSQSRVWTESKSDSRPSQIQVITESTSDPPPSQIRVRSESESNPSPSQIRVITESKSDPRSSQIRDRSWSKSDPRPGEIRVRSESESHTSPGHACMRDSNTPRANAHELTWTSSAAPGRWTAPRCRNLRRTCRRPTRLPWTCGRSPRTSVASSVARLPSGAPSRVRSTRG